MMDVRDTALWALRMLLISGGGVLVERGALAAGELEAVVGAVVALAGVAWSWWARRAALRAEPPR